MDAILFSTECRVVSLQLFDKDTFHLFLQLFAYDTVNKNLSPKPGEQPKLPIPASLIAGACAGVSSTICTYPLELLKTRLTIQVCSYKTKAYVSFMSLLSI